MLTLLELTLGAKNQVLESLVREMSLQKVRYILLVHFSLLKSYDRIPYDLANLGWKLLVHRFVNSVVHLFLLEMCFSNS